MVNLDEQLCFSVYTAGMAISRIYKPVLDELQLTYPQYLVLNVLWEQDKRTIGSIARRLELNSSTITPLVKRLENAGFVVRVRNMDDERQVLVSLTPKGLATEPEARCLGESLVESSGMKVTKLLDLNQKIKELREALARAMPD